ncbi:MAG: DUF2459 domain-containing protein [Flavobacteriales bacterium]|nr:DUF2459 domain-containing protein [Flavobacteriales bacterium]
MCSCIPISSIDGDENKTHTLFLSTNGIHVDIILPVDEMTPPLLEGLDQDPDDLYYSFGWGDRNFFLTTPTWSDLTVESTMTSFIFDTPSLMYVSRAYYKRSDWIPVKITDSQNQKLQAYLLSTFQLDENNKKIVLEGRGYHHKDNFYESYGSYSCFSTCNSWVNSGLKESGMNACLWTPFDFGILWRYR